MEIRVPVSVGELLDKVSILEIKMERIQDHKRLVYVLKELECLRGVIRDAELTVPCALYADLKKVNEQLWDAEEALRSLEEKYEHYTPEFADAALLDIRLNDKRFVVKKEINEFFDSSVREQKSYKESVLARVGG